MNQGYGTEDRTARRTRRQPRRRHGEQGGGSDGASARLERERADAWFDSWLTPDAEVPAARTATARALALLEPDGWTTLHDLHRPGSARVTVEQIAVGPGGVVLVETLHWDGDVTVAAGTLRHRGHGRTPDVAAAAGAAGAVTALLMPSHRCAVRAVLCLAARDFDPVAVCGGAVVVGEQQLAAYLAGLPDRLTAVDVAVVADHLSGELAGPASPELLTVDDMFRPAAVWAAPDVPDPPEGPVEWSGDGTGFVQPAARGDALLHLGVVVLGLLTVGNVLLAWLGVAH